MKYLTPIELSAPMDFSGFELLRARVENLPAAPETPEPGHVYFDTTLEVFRGWDGTEWRNLSRAETAFATTSEQRAFGMASSSGSSSYAARADHKHGTPPHGNAEHAHIALSALAPPEDDVPMANKRLTGLALPVNTDDAATRGFVETVSNGIIPMAAVDCVATMNAATYGEQEIGKFQTHNSRVLLTNQDDPLQNGIWKSSPTEWVRAGDANSDGEIKVGSAVYVRSGINGGKNFICFATGRLGVGPGGNIWLQEPWQVGINQCQWTDWASPQNIQAGLGLVREANVMHVALADNSGLDLSTGALRVSTSIPRRITATVGNGVDTTLVVTVTTNPTMLTDAIVQVYEIATGETVGCLVQRIGGNVILSGFVEAPAENSLRVVVHL